MPFSFEDLSAFLHLSVSAMFFPFSLRRVLSPDCIRKRFFGWKSSRLSTSPRWLCNPSFWFLHTCLWRSYICACLKTQIWPFYAHSNTSYELTFDSMEFISSIIIYRNTFQLFLCLSDSFYRHSCSDQKRGYRYWQALSLHRVWLFWKKKLHQLQKTNCTVFSSGKPWNSGRTFGRSAMKAIFSMKSTLTGRADIRITSTKLRSTDLFQISVQSRVSRSCRKKSLWIMHPKATQSVRGNRSYLPDLIQLFITSKLWKGCPKWTEYTSKQEMFFTH